MLQVVQNIRTGATTVERLPTPIAPPGTVLVAVTNSLVSAGTERYVVELAKKSLLGKARERPDQVRRVLQKLKHEGLLSVATQVRAKLDEPMPLGYSAAGVVLACGSGVQEFKPGDRVAAVAPHAEVVAVGRNLCAPVPDDVGLDRAAYASVGAIALEGVRLARVTLGERVLVIGLGLIGQIATALLAAQGCRVFGVDMDPRKLELARAFGASETALGAPRDAVKAFSGGYGVDAVVITAATQSNEPIEFAADAARTKGRIVLVGVIGLNLPRPPFFAKELEFTVSSSLGPGRGDPSYEEKGIDYPIGHARWTAQRNMLAVLETIQSGKLPVEKLTTHRFSIDRASEAYELVTTQKEPSIGIVLDYPRSQERPERRIDLHRRAKADDSLGVSVIGAGNFARLILLPALGRAGSYTLRGLCTARGMNAVTTGNRYGFAFATTDADALFADRETNVVVIATRHDLHADLVVKALRAGKKVFVEKPLCIRPEELERIEACVAELGERCPLLMVGFNRRFAPATGHVRDHFRGVDTLSIHYRFASGFIPREAWPQDEDVGGGRILGEACHAIDACSAIAGSPPIRVYAESVGRLRGTETTDDRVAISLRHANGSLSTVAYEAGGDAAGPAERIEVFGGGRTAIVDEWNEVSLWRGGESKSVRGGKNKGHDEELRAFLDACRNGGEWPIAWAHLRGVAWASLMAVQSLREGVAFDASGELE